MNTRKLFALSLAAALLSAPFAVTANAATATHTTHTTSATRHHVAKPVRSTGRTAARAVNADRSADSLNAQSLARARGQ